MRNHSLKHPVLVLLLTVDFLGALDGWSPLALEGEGGEGASCGSWGEPGFCGDSTDSMAAMEGAQKGCP